LEMGTALKTKKASNLYEFWGDDLTHHINQELAHQKNKVLINLASQEYSKAIRMKDVEADIIDITFREWRNEKWTFISFNAKKARGAMARYIIREKIENVNDLKGFDLDGYAFHEELSSERELFFTK